MGFCVCVWGGGDRLFSGGGGFYYRPENCIVIFAVGNSCSGKSYPFFRGERGKNGYMTGHTLKSILSTERADQDSLLVKRRNQFNSIHQDL